jgi:hypothetical protein
MPLTERNSAYSISSLVVKALIAGNGDRVGLASAVLWWM